MARRFPVVSILAVLLLGACGRAPDLVVYCSLDQDFSEALIRSFEDQTGLKVDAQYDVERNKTVGLVNRILAESERPRADVYWNNEIAQTIRLKDAGATQAYASPSAEGIPAAFKDPESHWTGFAARARVVMFRTDREVQVPSSLADFTDPIYASKGAMALPLTGTTLTNITALSVRDGDAETLAWLTAARDAGLSFGSGNADVMRRTRDGDFDWCFTDTDDAAKAEDAGYPVAIRYLDQGDGAMLIPNTVTMVAGAPHPDAARQFIDWVLSAEVEAQLAVAASRQIPLRPGVTAPANVGLPGVDFDACTVDWVATAARLVEREQVFREEFVQ
jgi:iron(III) transport system substrate-binding protein